MTFDPTQPYYAREKINQTDEIAIITREILRFIKQMNPSHMSQWGLEDTTDTINLMKEFNYTAPQLSMAFNRLRSRAKEKTIDFNEFYKIISDVANHWDMYKSSSGEPLSTRTMLDDYMQSNPKHLDRVKNTPVGDSKAIAKFWFTAIKEDLTGARISMNSPLWKIAKNLKK